jgi:restriction system protein
MPIPEFNEIKAPALQFFADGNEHHIKEVYESLAKHFSLTEEELSQVLPSGRQLR